MLKFNEQLQPVEKTDNYGHCFDKNFGIVKRSKILSQDYKSMIFLHDDKILPQNHTKHIAQMHKELNIRTRRSAGKFIGESTIPTKAYLPPFIPVFTGFCKEKPCVAHTKTKDDDIFGKGKFFCGFTCCQ